MRPITVTAAAGTRSSELDSLLQGGSRFWGLVPPIDPARFDAGQRRAQVEANQAAQRAQVAAAERSLSLVDASDRLRASSQLELLDAQRQLAAALQGLVTLRQTGQGDRVALRWALGGRWGGGPG